MGTFFDECPSIKFVHCINKLDHVVAPEVEYLCVALEMRVFVTEEGVIIGLRLFVFGVLVIVISIVCGILFAA